MAKKYVSVVDYMNANKLNSSYSNRAKLAKSYGIKNYSGTAQQNTALLGYLQTPKKTTTSTTKKTTLPTKYTPGAKYYNQEKKYVNKTTTSPDGKYSLSGSRKPVVKLVKDPVTGKMVSEEFLANKQFYNDYKKKIITGTNDVKDLARYQEIMKRHGFKGATTSASVMQDLSIRALNGDKDAQAYLKARGYKALEGDALWNGYDTSKLQDATGAKYKYLEDNPYSAYTKDSNMKEYARFNKYIENNVQMSPRQMERYKTIVKNWGLDDYTDPLVMQRVKTERDKTDAEKRLDDYLKTTEDMYNKDRDSILGQLDEAKDYAMGAQDTALNNSLNQQNATNFQQYQSLMQSMNERGLGNSGIAEDQYARMNMASNRGYQDAMADAALNKAGINTDFTNQKVNTQSAYTDRLASLKSDYTDRRNSTTAQYTQQIGDLNLQKSDRDLAIKQKEDELKLAEEQIKSQERVAMAENQLKTDEMLTKQRGVLYMNGKPYLTKQGKLVYTVDYLKMTETQRHNLAQEALEANKISLDYAAAIDKNNATREGDIYDYNAAIDRNNATREGNAYDYQVGMDRNNATREGNQLDYNLGMAQDATKQLQIQADLQVSMAQIQLDEAKLDFDYAKLESDNALAQEDIKIAAENAQTKKDKETLTALGKQSNSLSKQIVALKKKKKLSKKEKAQLKELVKKYNDVNNKITSLTNSM